MADSPLELAITKFAEEKLLWEAEGSPFCGTQVVWEYPISEEEEIVYVGLYCAMVIVQDNDLRETGGFSQEMLLKVRKDNDNWSVVDYDGRVSPNQTPAPWVAEYLSKIPEDIESKLDGGLISAKLVTKAGQALGVTIRDYESFYCMEKSDCQDNQVCYRYDPRIPDERNKCVTTCSTQEECGAGYSCRFQCINGDANGTEACLRTLTSVCVPDLVAKELDKSGKPW